MLQVKSNLRPTVSKFFDESWNSLFDWNKPDYSRVYKKSPSVNVSENSDAYVIEMAIPGKKKEDFEIELQNNLLVIGSLKKEESSSQETNFYRKEYSYESFRRTFSLDQEKSDLDNLEAFYNDGILKIVIPKLENAKLESTRRIEVS